MLYFCANAFGERHQLRSGPGAGFQTLCGSGTINSLALLFRKPYAQRVGFRLSGVFLRSCHDFQCSYKKITNQPELS